MGRGPTRSTWMCKNLCCGTGMGWMAGAGCFVTFAPVQAWQSLTQALMSDFMAVQITLDAMCLQVALVSEWAMLLKAAKVLWWCFSRMTGLGWGMDMLQRMWYCPKLMSLMDKLDPLVASMLGQVRCDTCRAALSIGSVAAATVVGRGMDSMLAMTLSVPPM